MHVDRGHPDALDRMGTDGNDRLLVIRRLGRQVRLGAFKRLQPRGQPKGG